LAGPSRTYGVGVYRGKNTVCCALTGPSLPLGFRQPSDYRLERPV
jgi:hypothetical protein